MSFRAMYLSELAAGRDGAEYRETPELPKVRRLTRAQWAALPADYKATVNGQRMALTLNPHTQATELWPVEFIE